VLPKGSIRAVLFSSAVAHSDAVFKNWAVNVGVLLSLEPASPSTPNVRIGSALVVHGDGVAVETLRDALRSPGLVVSVTPVELSWWRSWLIKTATPIDNPAVRLNGVVAAGRWVYLTAYFVGTATPSHAALTDLLRAYGLEVINPVHGIAGFFDAVEDWKVGEEGIILVVRSSEPISAASLHDMGMFNTLEATGGMVVVELATSEDLNDSQGYMDVVNFFGSGEALIGSIGAGATGAMQTASAALDLGSDVLGVLDSAFRAIKRNFRLVLGVGLGLGTLAGGWWLWRKYKGGHR
jgi:hypothetical protein